MQQPEHPPARPPDFFRRLRERKLVQWVLAYLAGAWLVLQLFGAVRESVGWSPAAGRVVIALLLLGLFVTLVLAWYHGEQGRQRVSGPELLMLAALLVIAGGVTWRVGRGGAPPQPAAAASLADSAAPPPAAARAIAVLPFANLSDSRENEYFSDGITEDILTNLSQAGGLRVISRTSSMAYRGSDKRLRQIAAELGVSHVVEGSVRRAGDRVRITAQLIEASTDKHLWAQSYDRELRDVFQVQSEIARQIAAALRVELTRDEQERIAAAPTSSLTAYDYYVQGRQYFFRFTHADVARARALFQRAVTLDPDFALAYAWLARASMSRSSVVDSSEALSRKAIALDPDLSDGYAALGEWHRQHGRFSLALEQFRKAVTLNPSDATATAEIGQTYSEMGRLDEAIPWLKRAVSLDPRTVWPYAHLGYASMLFGNLDEAERWYRRGLELQPDDAWSHAELVSVYQRRGDLVQAREHARTAAARDSRWAALVGWLELVRGNLPAARGHYERAAALLPGVGKDHQPILGYIYWKLGEREKAEDVLRGVERAYRLRVAEGDESYLPHLYFAIIHATRGQRGRTLRELEEAAARGWRDVWGLSNDPIFAELRGERRFQEIVDRMRAEVERQRLRVEREGL